MGKGIHRLNHDGQGGPVRNQINKINVETRVIDSKGRCVE